ncbi:MAG TPA: PD-(D/E)XK nuclease family protein, partial [Ramlibacter sp.]
MPRHAMDAIAQTHQGGAALDALMSRVRDSAAARGTHVARTVVLLPFAHLLQPAREAWARQVPEGFSPRLETTKTWSSAAGFEPADNDVTGDVARDLLAAHGLLVRAGLGSHADLLAPRLVEAAHGLMGVASAIEPRSRTAWAARMRGAIAPGFDTPLLSHEGALAHIAIEWAASSAFPTDNLFAPA